jgi:hypothetical protein
VRSLIARRGTQATAPDDDDGCMADRHQRVRLRAETLHRLTDLAAMRALEYRGRANHYGSLNDAGQAAQWDLMAREAEEAVHEARTSLGEDDSGPSLPEPPVRT